MLATRSLPLGLVTGLCLACGASVPMMESDVFVAFPTSEDNCATLTTRIEHLDDPTELGFSAVDVLTRLAGPRSSPLTWLEPAENQEYVLTSGTEVGSSALSLDLRAGEGPVLHRYRMPLLGAPEDTTCDSSGFLAIPVSVTLESAGQGLAESFDAVLEARVPYRGHLSKTFVPGTLRGSLGLLHVSSLDPLRSFWLGPVSLEADIWEGGSAGSIAVAIGASHAKESKELRAPPSPAEQPGPLATWPSAQSCDEGASALPANAKVLGFSVEDVLGRLREGGPRELTGSDGSVTQVQLELDADQPELCQQVGESLNFSVMARARSADGSLDVRRPVQVSALDAGGSIGEINVAEINTGDNNTSNDNTDTNIESAQPDAP